MKYALIIIAIGLAGCDLETKDPIECGERRVLLAGLKAELKERDKTMFAAPELANHIGQLEEKVKYCPERLQ